MGKTLDWVREEASGRLIYRRRYPEKLRPFLPKPGTRELKVPLGSKTYITPDAFSAYEDAKRQYQQEVKAARAALLLHEKEAAGRRDALSPDVVATLAKIFLHDWHNQDEADLRARGGEWTSKTKAGWEELLSEFREWRTQSNFEAMEERWGRSADALLKSEGVYADPDDTEGRKRLIWALNDAALEYHEAAEARLAGMVVQIPPRPERPANPKGRARTVSALLDAYKAAKWEGWGESSRKAVAPVLRLLRDTIGDRPADGIDRASAREVFELVKRLPVNLGKIKALEGLTVPEAVEEAAKQGLPTIGPNTVNKAYMVQIAAVYNWAVKEEWSAKNAFTGLTMDDPVDDRDRRGSFTLAQLTQLFSAAPWAERQPDGAARPGRFWIPLIALFSGMRLGEIAGLRLMDVEELEGILALRIRPHDLRGLKNKESRRDLPVHSALLGFGFASYVEHRRKAAKATDLLFPDAPANSRLQAGAKLGERFSRHLRDKGIVGTKLGMHSFRHNFEDRLRVAGLHGRPEGQALGGRKIAGSEASYGGAFPIAHLQEALEKVTYPGLDLSHLQP
nr:site-specific integrase [Sphingobium sp.]